MPEHTSLAAALVAAQAQMPKLEPDATNPAFKSKYVTLDNVIEHALPIANAHGIAVVQFPTTLENGDLALETTLVHGTSGESRSSTLRLLIDKSTMQGLGSAITYARRYMLLAAFGLGEGEDDDGNRATGSQTQKPTETPKPTAAQKRRLDAAIENGAKIDAERFSIVAASKLADAKFSKPLAELSRDEFEYVAAKIEQAAKSAAEAGA